MCFMPEVYALNSIKCICNNELATSISDVNIFQAVCKLYTLQQSKYVIGWIIFYIFVNITKVMSLKCHLLGIC